MRAIASTRFSPLYRPAISSAVIQQTAMLVQAVLILDGGGTFRGCCVAALAHWAAIVMIVARRPSSPTRFDLAIVRYGFWMMFLLMLPAAPIAGTLRGILHN